MIDLAVILAAGLGSRLKKITKTKPKGFFKINGEPLIVQSIEKLKNAGINQIYIGTGYLDKIYTSFFQDDKNIKCIKNEKYPKTGSMYTLYNMRTFINKDFLLLESDLLYEKKAIDTLLEDNREDIILGSGKTYSEGEVFIETNENNMLISMSKNPCDFKKISAELVGISKISLSTFKLMCDELEDKFPLYPKIDYEYIFMEISMKKKIPVKKNDDLIWCEIDDENHLKRAQEQILPKILIKNKNKIKSNALKNC